LNPLILHITNVANLPGILAQGGLWSPNHRPATAGMPISSAHANIQERRASTPVPCGPGGVLHDYAPFYFGARSPMLYANHTGFAGSGGQRPLIYLVSDVQTVIGRGCRFVFTDGHAELLRGLTRAFDHPGALVELDWQAIHATWWNSPPETKRKKQAEFLVHRFCPWPAISQIGVLDPTMQQQVEALLTGHPHPPPVIVQPAWYY
jgi:hypothetical protein